MASTRTPSKRTGTAGYERNAYVAGTAARQADPARRLGRELEQPKKQLSHSTRKNRERAKYMNLAYVLFLTAAMAVTGIVLVGYIRMESAITQSVETLESQLNNIRTENDENLNRIESSIDLNEIRRIAITELGMVYAGEGQIVEIPDEGSDYVRKYADIKK